VAELNDGDRSDSAEPRLTVVEVPGAEGEVALEVTGEIDISSVAALRVEIDRAIKRAPRTLILDLAGVQFMDSSGIAVLLTAAEQIGLVEVRNPSEVIRRLIALTGLTDILRIAP
jgi:anti-anti-sigma factor